MPENGRVFFAFEYLPISLGVYRKGKIYIISTEREESDYVAQYNFYDTSQLEFHGEVATISS